jgi:tetratricopeptide (TPR) repeat protein
VKLDTHDSISYSTRSHVYVDLGNFDEALADITRAIELDPGYARYHLNRARIHLWSLSDYESAIADLERAIELNPDSLDAYDELSRVYINMGEWEEFYAVVDRLREISVDWKDKEKLAEVLNLVALALEHQGDMQAAVDITGEMIALQPENPWTHANRADYRKRTGDLAGREEDCDRIAEMKPDDPDDIVMVARMLQWTCDRPEDVIASYTRVIELAPHWADPYNWRGVELMHFARYEDALADYDRAIELAPNAGSFLRDRAWILEQMERFDEAVRDYDRYFALGYDDPGVRGNRAFLLSKLGKTEAALAEADRMIELAPKEGEGYRTRAQILEFSGDVDGALIEIERAIEVEPGDMWGYWYRIEHKLLLNMPCSEVRDDLQKWRDLIGGNPWADVSESRMHTTYLHWFCPELSEKDKALAMARRVVEYRSDFWFNWEVLGIALYRAGSYGEARDALQKSLELQWLPHPPTLFTMAEVQWKLGERAQARSYYEQAVERMNSTWPDRPEFKMFKQEAAQLLGIE